MKKQFYAFALAMGLTIVTNAQTKIKDGTISSGSLPNAGAVLELESNNKGLLNTRVSLTNTEVWGLAGTPVAGMMVYNTNISIISTDDYPTIDGGKGVYYWDGGGWVTVGNVPNSDNDTLTIVEGEGVPTGPCTEGNIYVDVLEDSPTEGQFWFCSGGSWTTWTPPNTNTNTTPWMITGTATDALGSKNIRIWRRGFIGISPTFSNLKPVAPLHIVRSGGGDGNQDNILLESYGTSTSPLLVGKAGRGFKAAPANLTDDMTIVGMQAQNYSGGGIGSVRIQADGNHANTSTPTKIVFFTTNAGNTGGSIKMTLSREGNLGINRSPVTNRLEVGGNASKNTAGDWLANSDSRLKKNITYLKSEELLAKLLQMKGVSYEWNDNKTGSDRPVGVQYGFIAQDIQKVFPANVEEDALGYLQTAYGTYDYLYVEAIKALNKKVEALEKENAALKALVTQSNDLKQNYAQLAEQVKELQIKIGVNPSTSGARGSKK